MTGEMGPTVVGTEKTLSMKQVEVGKGKGAATLGPTIVGTEKVLSMKQVETGKGAGSKNE